MLNQHINKNLSDLLFIGCIVLFLIVIGYFGIKQSTRKITWEDRYQIINTTTYKSSFSRREKQSLIIQQEGKITYWNQEEGEKITKVKYIEVTDEAYSIIKDKLKDNDSLYLTYKELDELRGRSNLGKAWDWLKKPR